MRLRKKAEEMMNRLSTYPGLKLRKEEGRREGERDRERAKKVRRGGKECREGGEEGEERRSKLRWKRTGG